MSIGKALKGLNICYFSPKTEQKLPEVKKYVLQIQIICQ